MLKDSFIFFRKTTYSEIFCESVSIKNELRNKKSITSEVQFYEADNFRSDHKIPDKKNIVSHYQNPLDILLSTNYSALLEGIWAEILISFIFSFFIILLTKHEIKVKV